MEDEVLQHLTAAIAPQGSCIQLLLLLSHRLHVDYKLQPSYQDQVLFQLQLFQFDQFHVTSNPKDHEVLKAYETYMASECDGVVSVGGGSSHDCGKGVRAVAANDGRPLYDMAAKIDPPWMEERLKFKSTTIRMSKPLG